MWKQRPPRSGACYMDWIITGGESGPTRRPLDMDAVRSIRDQCARNGVTFHHKQNGGFRGKDNGCLVDGVESGKPVAMVRPVASVHPGKFDA